MHQTIEISSGNGHPFELTVFINSQHEPPPFFASPPHTVLAPRLARVAQGSNAFGSVDLDLYACADDAYDPCRLVLWGGFSGSQADDDIGRLEVEAWIDLSDQELDDDEISGIYDPAVIAALLTATLAEWLRDEWIDPDSELEAGTVLDQPAIDCAWNAAISAARR